jgi:hypothetical protein
MLDVLVRMQTSDFKIWIRAISILLIKICVGLNDLGEIDFPKDMSLCL